MSVHPSDRSRQQDDRLKLQQEGHFDKKPQPQPDAD